MYEIERKFLVNSLDWKKEAEGILYRQGYITTQVNGTVRVRIIGDRGILTIKGKSIGAKRLEFEYDIPLEEAKVMLDELCQKPLIEKYRYKINVGKHVYEVDEFLGENEGLIIAEVELTTESEAFQKPNWLGKEVTDDNRYFNSNLVEHPYQKWTNKS